MFVWPYVCLHILCTQLVICLLSHFIHIWFLGWPWSEHVHIMPISRMVDFCESYSPFHVCLTICPSHILCTQLVICLLSHFIHIWYHGWPWSEHAHIMPISRMVDFCESYSPFHVCLTMSFRTSCVSHLSFVILFIFGILIGHDLSMPILYRFHGWLIFVRVIALFMFVCPYVRPHILCTQLKSFVFWRILFIFGILIDHDLSMHILYRFHGWLILWEL